MKNKFLNTTHLEGYIYDHDLKIKVTGENAKAPGTTFINGVLNIATDDNITNIVPVHYTYVTATTSKGENNNTFAILKGIIDGQYNTVMASGKENAAKVRIDSSIGLNEFFSDRTGTEELVSVKRNEGGFIHVINTLNENENERNTFSADMVITNVRRIEADPDKDLPEKGVIKGCIFDFRKAILPVEFTVLNAAGIDYFESLDASAKNPVFTKVWGRQISQTVVKTLTEEGADWGEDSVRTVQTSRKDWVIASAAKEPYTFGSEDDDMSKDFLVKAMSDREVYVATIKTRQDEYKASKAAAATSAVPSGDTFNF